MNQNLRIGLFGGGAILLIVIIFLYKSSNDQAAKADMLEQQLRVAAFNDSVRSEQINSQKDAEEKQRLREVAARNRKLRNGWFEYVRVQNTKANQGGLLSCKLRDFSITVENIYDFPLDAVTVTVNYHNSRGEIEQTRTRTFNDIPAHDSMVDMGEEVSGVCGYVTTQVTGIKCRELNMWMRNETGNGDGNDPFFHRFN
ncbi:MAG: hypothetical protein EOO06_13465 [Chitinophagaceae bacterium]|nr:MAG: hypothetical protein EOO06_13465 [Chitinophagaceae bacterium]